MSAPPIGWTTHATVSRVIDGDTVEVDVNRRLVIRLKDCWAPERSTVAGRKSMEHVNSLIMPGDDLIVQIDGSDRDMIGDLLTFSRFVGDIWIPGDKLSLAEQQIKAGHAYPTKLEQTESES